MKTDACGIFPWENTGIGMAKNESPEFNWTAGPEGTQSYAILMQDLTFQQNGMPFVHWVIWNIPGDTRKLPANLPKTATLTMPAGAEQRSFSGNGYQGSGKCGNVYEFILFALPAALTPNPTSTATAASALRSSTAPKTTLRARSAEPECG